MKRVWLVTIVVVGAMCFSGGSFVLAADLDCDTALREATVGRETIEDWSNPGVGTSPMVDTSPKKEINRVNGDYCLLQRSAKITDSEIEDQEVKITYFADPKKAVEAMYELRSSEPKTFKASEERETYYLGATYVGGKTVSGIRGIPGFEVSGPFYGRAVMVAGNCLIEAKDGFVGSWIYLEDEKDKYIKEWLEPMQGNVRGFVNGLAKHPAVTAFCGGGKSVSKLPWWQKKMIKIPVIAIVLSIAVVFAAFWRRIYRKRKG